MKTKATILFCAAAILFAGNAASLAGEKPAALVKVVDAVIVRPLSLGSTAFGSVLFVLSLPVTAITKDVKPAANALVCKPAWQTFKRPLGDMDAMAD